MDIRVLTTFPTHRKIRRLIKTLGYEAVYSLISLWAYTAENHPKGNLVGYDEIDVEEAANWDGEPTAFLREVMSEKTCFVLKIKGGYALRNWEKHQGWIVNAPARREKARLAAAKRWDATSNATSNATGNATGNAKNEVEQCPYPSPLPSPKPKPIKNTYSNEFEMFWAEYPRKKEKKNALKSFDKAIKDGVGLSDLIEGAKKYALSVEGKEQKYIKHPKTWLNGGCWDDEHEETKPDPNAKIYDEFYGWTTEAELDKIEKECIEAEEELFREGKIDENGKSINNKW